MISILSKPKEQVGIDDLCELIQMRIPEGEQIEYKRELPFKDDGETDNWLSNGKLGNRAKDSLIKEVIALINTSGGVIILGIGQSADKPPVAQKIQPIPRCAELADALTYLFLTRIEPQIPPFEIVPIKTEEENGVVAVRVRKSQKAPHRDTKTRESYVRRHDQCRKMSMRDIQDMTMNSARGLEGLEKRFEKRTDLFQNELKYLINPDDAFGIRLTAIPHGSDVWFNRVYDNSRILPQLEFRHQQVFEHTTDGRKEKLRTIFDNCGFNWRPAVRAARGDSDTTVFESRHGHASLATRFNFYVEIHCDGMVELGLVAHHMHRGDWNYYVSPDLPAVLFANLVAQVHQMRMMAGTPMADYVVDVAILVRKFPRLMNSAGPQFGFPVGKLDPGFHTFPRYVLNHSDDFLETLNLFHRDFYNSLGQDYNRQQFSLVIENWPYKSSVQQE